VTTANAAVAPAPKLMEGEDPSTENPADARSWISIYDQMIHFKLRLLDQLNSELLRLPVRLHPDVKEDLFAIEDQLERYRVRLDFWYGRHFALAGVIVDDETRTVTHRDESVQLTGREFQLLHIFLGHPDRFFTSRQLILDAWHDPSLSGEELRLYISSLRRKLKQINVGAIVNRPTRGYSLLLNGLGAKTSSAIDALPEALPGPT
jgi:hypothetical protein